MPTSTPESLHYLDANALWKFYRDQRGDVNIRRLVTGSSSQVLISPVTVLEFIGVLVKYYRKGLVGRRHVNRIAKRLRRDSAMGNTHRPLRMIPLPEGFAREAKGILLQQGCTCSIQTNDAIHLAIVLRLEQDHPATLVTSDRALQKTAQRRGVAWYDPEAEESDAGN